MPDMPQFDHAMTPAERRAAMREWERAKEAEQPKQRGHAARPGTGPAGETCATCAHMRSNELAKTYFKCGHPIARPWTGGGGTDVRARDPACSKWEAKNVG